MIENLHQQNTNDHSETGNNEVSTNDLNQIRTIEEEIDNLNISPLSSKAYDFLKQNITDYIRDILSEAFRIAKRQKADNVSQSHIEQASINLIAKRKSKWKYLVGTIGGILLGTGFSNIYTMASGKINFFQVMITAVFLTLGSILITLNITDE